MWKNILSKVSIWTFPILAMVMIASVAAVGMIGIRSTLASLDRAHAQSLALVERSGSRMALAAEIDAELAANVFSSAPEHSSSADEEGRAALVSSLEAVAEDLEAYTHLAPTAPELAATAAISSHLATLMELAAADAAPDILEDRLQAISLAQIELRDASQIGLERASDGMDRVLGEIGAELRGTEAMILATSIGFIVFFALFQFVGVSLPMRRLSQALLDVHASNGTLDVTKSSACREVTIFIDAYADLQRRLTDTRAELKREFGQELSKHVEGLVTEVADAGRNIHCRAVELQARVDEQMRRYDTIGRGVADVGAALDSFTEQTRNLVGMVAYHGQAVENAVRRSDDARDTIERSRTVFSEIEQHFAEAQTIVGLIDLVTQQTKLSSPGAGDDVSGGAEATGNEFAAAEAKRLAERAAAAVAEIEQRKHRFLELAELGGAAMGGLCDQVDDVARITTTFREDMENQLVVSREIEREAEDVQRTMSIVDGATSEAKLSVSACHEATCSMLNAASELNARGKSASSAVAELLDRLAPD